jgi:hypothetical protein
MARAKIFKGVRRSLNRNQNREFKRPAILGLTSVNRRLGPVTPIGPVRPRLYK